jgi:hypothetical protein
MTKRMNDMNNPHFRLDVVRRRRLGISGVKRTDHPCVPSPDFPTSGWRGRPCDVRGPKPVVNFGEELGGDSEALSRQPFTTYDDPKTGGFCRKELTHLNLQCLRSTAPTHSRRPKYWLLKDLGASLNLREFF